ncbi:putative reverse transcriptase domain-containing protein [Tanacetum coccineum]
MKSGLVSINTARQNISKTAVSVNTARQVNAAHTRTTMNVARLMSYLSKKAHSTVKRPIHKNTTFKNSNFNQRVNTVKDKNVNIVRPKAIVNAVRPKAVVDVGNPQMDLQDKGVIDSGCSRHMTRNMSYLTDYEQIYRGYMAFGGNPKGGKIIKKDETSGILKSFITRIENLVDHKVKVIRCDNGTNFMRPFGCPITILNTIDHFGKFNGKDDEGFFVRYSLNSKAFRVFNSRTRIVEENLHIRFSENTPNVVGTQSNGFVGTKASDNADTKSSQDDGSKPSSDDEKMVDEDPIKDSKSIDQEKDDNVNNINNVNAAITNKVNAIGGKTSIELPDDPNMPALEDISIFDLSRDNEDVGAEADMNNLDTTMQVSLIPTTRIHKDHPLNQVIGDLQSATQTRNISKNLEEHGFVSTIQQRTNHKDLQNYLFACFLSQEEPKKVIHALKDPSWIEAMQEELLQFKIKAIRLFLAYASFKDFVMYQMDVRSAFLYGKIKEEVYVCQPPGFEDPDFPDRLYKVEKALYGLHQAPRAWSMIGSLMYLTSSRPNIMFVVYACARYQVNPKVSHLHAMKRIFRYLKGQPKLGLWYPKDSPFDLVAYIDSDYAGASLDRKSTIGGCQFFGFRLISWQCKKQTEAEYVATASCYG